MFPAPRIRVNRVRLRCRRESRRRVRQRPVQRCGRLDVRFGRRGWHRLDRLRARVKLGAATPGTLPFQRVAVNLPAYQRAGGGQQEREYDQDED